ncbi:MAG: endonuclease, partial [Flavobacteriaceae bacterium]|nr:endonuclease [Flavobacteriaceae bacterium]
MSIVLNSKYFWKKFYHLIFNIAFSSKRNLIVIFLLIYFQAFTQIPEYYEDIDFSISSEGLYNDLSQLVTTSQTGLSYSAIWNLLQQADLDPNDETLTNLLLVYGFNDEDGISSTDRSRDKDLNCNFSGNCDGYWNREHVFPQSLANPPMTTSTIGTGTDAHNLRACDVQANSQRGNNKFVNGSGDPFYGGVDNYYPGDEWRGDVARIILYMYLRYQEECLPSYVGSGLATYNANIPDIFLDWNVIDAVSDFEIQRNEVIYQFQGNRNPFIDNPYLASLLWGGPTAQNTWPLDGSDIVLDSDFTPVNEIDYQDYISSSPLTVSSD